MDDVQKGLLNEIAAGLLRASEAARALAEHEPEKVTFELDGGIDLKWLYRASHDNPGASDKLPVDSSKT